MTQGDLAFWFLLLQGVIFFVLILKNNIIENGFTWQAFVPLVSPLWWALVFTTAIFGLGASTIFFMNFLK